MVGSPLDVGGDMDGVFCVSDGPCRKRKFLLALAVGLPCVSFQFVLECVKQVRHLVWCHLCVMSPLCDVTSMWCHLCVVSLLEHICCLEMHGEL